MQNNFTFLPTRRRHENGSQVSFSPHYVYTIPRKELTSTKIFAFGNVQIILEKGKVCVQDGGTWHPITPEALIARTKVGR